MNRYYRQIGYDCYEVRDRFDNNLVGWCNSRHKDLMRILR
jgi:hypothetical protein